MKNNKQYLDYLYHKKFECNQEIKRLRNSHDFPDDNETIRNDQSITMIEQRYKILDELIDEYLRLMM